MGLCWWQAGYSCVFRASRLGPKALAAGAPEPTWHFSLAAISGNSSGGLLVSGVHPYRPLLSWWFMEMLGFRVCNYTWSQPIKIRHSFIFNIEFRIKKNLIIGSKLLYFTPLFFEIFKLKIILKLENYLLKIKLNWFLF